MSTILDHLDAAQKYILRLSGTEHDKKAALRNIDLARSVAKAEPKVAAAAPVPSTGPLTQAGIDAAMEKYNAAFEAIRGDRPVGSGPTPTEALEIATRLAIVREVAYSGAFGEPGTTAGVDYSGYSRYVVKNETDETWVYVEGKLVNKHFGGPTAEDEAQTVGTIK